MSSDHISTLINTRLQVFESVVPSECTRLTVGAVDISVYLRAMDHPGAAVLHLDEIEFSTELAGNSSESAFKLSVLSSHFFLVDSIQDAFESTGIIRSPFGGGLDSWKVRHTLFADRLSAKR